MQFKIPILILLLGQLALAEGQWFKGNTHTHSLWSDGDGFPDMIADWYKERGYHFLVLSDHDVLSRGERWMKTDDVEKRRKGIGEPALGTYLERFGEEWVELRGEGEAQEVRLKNLPEMRTKFEEEGKFLMIEGEEISDGFKGAVVHINAINLAEVIKPQHGESLRETMRNNLLAVEEQAKRLERPILAHINHPNFHWSITAEDIAHVMEERFFEVYNGHPGINHLGSEEPPRPGDEKIWDIANTLRLAVLGGELLYGIASDDSHTYHGGDVKPGRGWIMIRSEKLDADALIHSMKAGDFYASTGVSLDSIGFDPETNILEIRIAGSDEKDGRVTTKIHGTLRGEEGDPAMVGKELASYDTRTIRHQLTGKEWFVRATVTSENDHVCPSFPGQKQQAWTQPVMPGAE